MGFPKAFMPLGNTTLIETVISRLQPIFRRVLVVARNSKELRDLNTVILTDHRLEKGPLVGLARGLSVSDAPWCFVAGCDMPFLRPEVIQRMAAHLNDGDVLVPNVAGHLQPLHAFYSQRCCAVAKRQLDHGITSIQSIFSSCDVSHLEADTFLDIDPELLSFRDVDTTDDYHEAQKLVQGRDHLEVRP